MNSIIEQLLPENIQKTTYWESFENQEFWLSWINGHDEIPENQGIIWKIFWMGIKSHFAVWGPHLGKEKELKSENNMNLISASRLKDPVKLSPFGLPGNIQEF